MISKKLIVNSLLKLGENVLKRRKRPRSRRRDHLQADIRNVVVSAGILQISEFRLFQVAYFDWYGVDISEKELEPIFTNYLLRDVVPHWVRQLARIVISRDKEGALNPRDFNIESPKTDPELQRAGWNYIIMLVLVLVLFLVLISDFPPD